MIASIEAVSKQSLCWHKGVCDCLSCNYASFFTNSNESNLRTLKTNATTSHCEVLKAHASLKIIIVRNIVQPRHNSLILYLTNHQMIEAIGLLDYFRYLHFSIQGY